MRNLIAIPVILLAVILQSAVISRVYLLSGSADLPLVMLTAWALQEEVESSWHWAVALGLMVGFVSAIPGYVPVLSYVIVVWLAEMLQRRVWQAPLLAMFSVTFLGTFLLHILTYVVLRVGGVSMPLEDVLGLLVLPGVLLNLLLAIPVYAIMRDLSRWVYPVPEVE
ncbi:MAG TPA: rod shape-determining protein MreD [Anaerolineales bacterium]|nr:rod shape-determining protein MreD [Anaerolineales bacterium]